MKEALGMGRIESDSDESKKLEEQSEEESSDLEEEEETEPEEGEEEKEKQPEVPGMSKRAMKKRARELSIQSIRERHAQRKLKVIEKKKSFDNNNSTLGSESNSKRAKSLSSTATHASSAEPASASKIQLKKQKQKEKEGKLKETDSNAGTKVTEGKKHGKAAMKNTKASIAPPIPIPNPPPNAKAKLGPRDSADANSATTTNLQGAKGKDTLEPPKKKKKRKT
ncbi:hypothetical protein BT96DRAFT_919872 [Gymnopus androsaceus JB14]|uniref:Uncharacterized protein n=1 Tax=Gymnopus androsaceus JB14 TaxID=1447944 RepID=A0A6A4HP02_9AGAR|nr:hypothetical protein BT96DRAFT_919872 [Gymnopus androsaceus JB14]